MHNHDDSANELPLCPLLANQLYAKSKVSSSAKIARVLADEEVDVHKTATSLLCCMPLSPPHLPPVTICPRISISSTPFYIHDMARIGRILTLVVFAVVALFLFMGQTVEAKGPKITSKVLRVFDSKKLEMASRC